MKPHHRPLVLAVALVYAVMVYGGGWLKTDYDLVSQFTSELTSSGTDWADTIATAHVVWGILGLALLWVAAPLVPVSGVARGGYWLLASEPGVWIGSAFLPCDPGCPFDGSLTQTLHNLWAAITFVATTVGLLLLARNPAVSAMARLAWALLAVFWLATFVLMLMPAAEPVRGLIQRLGEGTLYGTLCVVAWRLRVPPRCIAPVDQE
ncbi:MAG: DUF998 domain-containing protein [Holophagales bacterium]|nr:DUF998 domain-containing protein [Holophagales bacterium]MYH25285.1 DUF998 domain-containing protein [Holophagales bacterium]